ncbi:protein kinase [Nocardia beijingensis]|uniref:serine/threonine-protein kinase n=1 Tax=Nocardia beijingensis TaxID=95162 RepID=UPI00189574E8|nr:serine/threonine-protein kinase [Nocardia beijingensis]MBF6466377.1 protein kinase [Nocardia beijingensis]
MRERRIDNRYELTEEISSGGMGSVWRGYDIVLDREVAVKKIRLDQVQTNEQAEEFTQRFRQEARVTARIRHHGVPQVFDAVLDASFEVVYLVMELIDGIPLRDYINPGNPLPLTWVAAVAAQIATVLSHAHAIPVVHRDLKPDNVLVTREGAVKVIDFGIAAILDGGPRLTKTGQQIGTFRYMAPERVQGARIQNPSSDLYSLGCMVHEMVSGAPLFVAVSEFDLQLQHVDAQPQPLREIRPEVPADFERLVLDLVRKSPQDRPADACVVYERLLPFLPGPGAPVDPAELYLPGFPDPTRIFRRPNAPLETSQIEPTRLRPNAAPPTVPLSAMHLRTAIESAERRYNELLEQGRFDQAAAALIAVLDSAAEANGADNLAVLRLRSLVAAAWSLGGEHGKAKREFEMLAEAYRRVQGRFSEFAWDSRAGAARCRIALGDTDGGIAALRSVLDEVVSANSDGGEMALALRFDLGEMLASTGQFAEARTLLEALHDDLCVINGPADEFTVEVAGLLRTLPEEDLD